MSGDQALRRCSGCYDSFSGPWCDNCDTWPCRCVNPVCDSCEAEGFRLTYSPEHGAEFCDGCYERENGHHPTTQKDSST